MRFSQRVFQMAVVAMITATPAFAQGGMAGMDHDAAAPVEGGGKLPAGWSARTDQDRPLSNVKFEKMGEGWHFTMGGTAAVLYRETDKATGNYHTVAKLTQTKSPRAGHGEGMGIIIGGSDLAGPNQAYTYFLVRQDGMFIIKRRTGATTSTLVDWTENAAVNKADAAGKATNEVAIGVSGGKASFTVNGKEVYSTDAAKIDANGIVGLRVNHMLDVHADGFAIHKL